MNNKHHFFLKSNSSTKKDIKTSSYGQKRLKLWFTLNTVSKTGLEWLKMQQNMALINKNLKSVLRFFNSWLMT